MERREVIAGAASLAAVAGGVAYLHRPADGEAVEPLEIETLEAPGSEAGWIQVPERGNVTFVEFFATWCSVCRGMMPELAEAHRRTPEDVQFLSVTNEPVGHSVTREEVADWWTEHDGGWTVGVDSDLRLTDAVGASGVPTAVVVDADNHVVHRSKGEKSADEILEEIEDARVESQR